MLTLLWPLGQFLLVQAFHVSPWKLGAWGMYSTPARSMRIESVVTRTNGERVRFEAWSQVEDSLRRFQLWRRYLGTLATPADLADAILAKESNAATVEITLRERKLDSRTARIEERVTSYRRE